MRQIEQVELVWDDAPRFNTLGWSIRAIRRYGHYSHELHFDNEFVARFVSLAHVRAAIDRAETSGIVRVRTQVSVEMPDCTRWSGGAPSGHWTNGKWSIEPGGWSDEEIAEMRRNRVRFSRSVKLSYAGTLVQAYLTVSRAMAGAERFGTNGHAACWVMRPCARGARA